ncbi:hypothetical protein W02_33280 [Nitrospira sp. KM1]|uniref:hypothetical protein n=1 Tax=Nitrospira sp. KM1 TaxID=1936990 RepID=UPI0013A73C7E|nr:hypothetical protein [Nitrospira sp. KM1]BCA56188.1 hypothetical protein W02_33280 [Nitrospira sp. KM1]
MGRAVRRTIKTVMFSAVLLTGVGCISVAQVTTLSDEQCRRTFVSQLESILTEEGEPQDEAGRLAGATVTALASGRVGPRPFLVPASSGVDYGLFVQRKSSNCLLRLFSRQKGFVRYQNNLTYIATRQLEGCDCSE